GGRWRLMPLEDADARYIHRVIVGLACVFAVDLVLEVWLAGAGASLELTVLRKFGIGLAIAGLLLALVVRGSLWRTDVDHRRGKTGKSALWRGLRNLIAVLVLLIPVSAIAGYVAFSRLLGTQIVLTGGLYILVNAVNALCTELIDELLNKETLIGSEIRRNLELTDDGAELMAFWIKAAVYVVVYLGAFLTLLVIWGAGGEDLSEWLYTALFGFKVAGVTVSIATLFLAVALFSGVLVLTRLFQRFLERRILPRTRLDYGVQHSIRASVGYIGFIVAAMFAVTTLGIDMTKLAIIAGALSVGIGFGLQNVVNNFVSGLILLIERPIKVGDLVVVGDKQGYVKKIKVRATEILTFDRASVFIPNSELISQSLLNKTHADKIGRVILPVGVAYGADTQNVRDILLALASAHPDVLKNPAPSVLFKGFGDSCLDFELRAFLGDVDKVATVGSDLCFEIDAAFRKENIEIPFPQQDVHWRDMARLESLVDKILAERKK
ncbi:MAG: mechanosensitive ion channel family protein, partial [Gammaproteobacteria bacterium]